MVKQMLCVSILATLLITELNCRNNPVSSKPDSDSNGTTTDDKSAKALAARSDWKICDTIGTIGNDLSTNNKSGFSALPVGSRYINGVYGNRGLLGHWWTTTPTWASRVFSIYLTFKSGCVIIQNQQKTKGFAIRLVKG